VCFEDGLSRTTRHSKYRRTIQNMIKQFWDWFARHHFILRGVGDGNYDLIDDILSELRKIQAGLAAEFEVDRDLLTMTISADGLEENFEIVRAIVNNAPTIEGWNFVAFRQPVPRDKIDKITIMVKDLELDPKQLWFLPVTENDNLYVQIFHDSLTEDNRNDICYGSLMLLDNLIGEFDCVMKVKGYEFYNLVDAKDFKQDLKPLTKIRDFLDQYY
jgi:hypothetical protein